MAYRDTRESLGALHGIASAQGGYFTAKQAAGAGYDYPHLSYHLKAGNFDRADHGLYRIVTIPLSDQDQLIRLSLWSRDRQDHPQAIVSDETALALHELSDVLARRVHLTVPRTFRKPAPDGCALHTASLANTEIEQREGYSITTPLRTLIDAATGETVSGEQLARAIDDALQRGLVRRSKLESAANGCPNAAQLLQYL
jgi:predicted transcriptional regulator of viral defense system